MKIPQPVDYRQFRLSRLNTSEFSHLKYLIFWPVWALAFYVVEAVWIRDSYLPVSCFLDNAIPFCEYFMIPYMFWFVFLTGMNLYSLFFDTAAFRRMMKFIVIGYSSALIIYIIFPNCQELRPSSFERSNRLTDFVKAFYAYDTNTNVCPSLHVIGSVAAMLCGWDSKDLRSRQWKVAFAVISFWVSISTVFVKQHSIIDVFVSIPVCLLAWWISYCPSHVCAAHSTAVYPITSKAKSFDATLRASALLAAYHRNHSEDTEPDMEWFEHILNGNVSSKMCTETMKQQILETIKQRLGADKHASS